MIETVPACAPPAVHAASGCASPSVSRPGILRTAGSRVSRVTPAAPHSGTPRSALCRALHTEDADYYPEEVEDGWRCMCGAFNYNAGQGMYFCSECGMEKAMMQSALQAVEQAENPPQPQYDADMQFLPVQDAEPA